MIVLKVASKGRHRRRKDIFLFGLEGINQDCFVLQGAPEKWRLVRAHGTAVGLPTEDDMGNSEVGHNALGAGRIFAQG